MRRRTGKLLTGLALLRRRAAAQQAAQNRRRCSGCGAFLTAGGHCRKCEGQTVRPRG